MKKYLIAGIAVLALAPELRAQEEDPAARLSVLAKAIGSVSDLKALDRLFVEALGLLERLEGKDAEAKAELVAALKTNKEGRLKSLASKSRNTPALQKLRALKTELNQRRQKALDTIFDITAYFPEDHPNWKKGDKINGQEKVDALVLKKSAGSVQELWESASAPTVELDASVLRNVELVKAINEKCLARLDAAPELNDFADLGDLGFNARPRTDLKSFCLDSNEAELYEWNRRVDRYNEGLKDSAVGKTEREHVALINDYREMMGRRRLLLDARLCRATNKHSAACNAAGKIWHDGSDGTPSSRAEAEKFPDLVIENCAMGYATPADIWWRGWYRASDHHRNALREQSTVMGYGFVGKVGSQNFAKTDPPADFLER